VKKPDSIRPITGKYNYSCVFFGGMYDNENGAFISSYIISYDLEHIFF